ncbi:transmembrane and immunoglobulin domain-containing protein 2 [Ornithorhynchus anatinus]|uniref:transmembrane and immunoglobulin domain-containing protein 2 n=1 Tax=Ornithorhynchus anatinus TaxID=9258 RepID=UPI0004545A08|nr:transmembrane and immunoglobulin domain-containing protein 2 [Ornithorhynchus anatinus]
MGVLQGMPLFLGLLVVLERVNNLQINQEPQTIQVKPGSIVNINCMVISDEIMEQIRVEWLKNGTMLHSFLITNNMLNETNHPRGWKLSWRNHSLGLSLPINDNNDTGIYQCRIIVEIPQIKQGNGSGTIVHLKETKAVDPKSFVSDFIVWSLVMGGIASVTLVLAAVICCYRRHCRDTGEHFYAKILCRPKAEGQEGKRAGPETNEREVEKTNQGEKGNPKGQSRYTVGFPVAQPLHPAPCPPPLTTSALSNRRPPQPLRPRPSSSPRLCYYNSLLANQLPVTPLCSLGSPKPPQ